MKYESTKITKLQKLTNYRIKRLCTCCIFVIFKNLLFFKLKLKLPIAFVKLFI